MGSFTSPDRRDQDTHKDEQNRPNSDAGEEMVDSNHYLHSIVQLSSLATVPRFNLVFGNNCMSDYGWQRTEHTPARVEESTVY